MAFYDAKLAAFLSIPAKAVQPLQGVNDFGRLGLAACVRNHGNTINFLKANYPQVPLVILPTLPDALHAFEAGKCGGVIAVDLELLYEMGLNDPHGEYCGMELVRTPWPPTWRAVMSARDVSKKSSSSPLPRLSV